jgi:hypothetical protein
MVEQQVEALCVESPKLSKATHAAVTQLAE